MKDGNCKTFEASSTFIEIIDNSKAILYLLKDLTNYEKIKDLNEKQKYQQIYFASITHDFRTPLSIISGNTELLLDKIENEDDRKYLKNIHNASAMLSLLVQDILDFSQIKAGILKVTNSTFSITKEFLLIIELFKEKFETKGLFLKFHKQENTPDKVTNDCNRIKQILVNLVSNALKFTTKGGVRIKVKKDKMNNSKIKVSVKDTGVGISPENINKLFTEFGKLEQHSNLNPNGIGLGLKICKEIVEKLGGTIEVKSKINF